MSSIYDWSKTPADNANSDDGISWVEGMMPGEVNDSGRGVMVRPAEYVEDQGGGIVTENGPSTITVTIASDIESYFNGLRFAVRSITTNTGAATLNVNALGAKPIKVLDGSAGEVDPKAGKIRAGGIYDFAYSSAANSGNGAWILLNPTTAGASIALYYGTVANGSSASLTTGSWATAPIGTEEYDPSGLAALAASVITPTRACLFWWSMYAAISTINVGSAIFKTRLYNVTDSLVVGIPGSIVGVGSGDTPVSRLSGTSIGEAVVEANKQYRVEYYAYLQDGAGTALFNGWAVIGAPDLGLIQSVRVRLTGV